MYLKNEKKIFLFLLFTLILLLTACSSSNTSDVEISKDVNSDLKNEIIITGLTEDELILTVEEIRELETVSKEVTSVNSSGEEKTFEATGTLLQNILEQQGFSQRDLMGIRFVAGDGYSIEVPKDILDKRDIILVYEIDGAPLESKSLPLRVVIPDERAMYWVGNLKTIEVLEGVEKSEVSKILFLETLKETMNLEDYNYYNSVDKAIKTQDLLKNTEADNISETVYIKAADGLEKNETLSNFEVAYIKMTGSDIPTFLSPDMPKGMYVKDIFYFSYDTTAWISYEKAQEKLENLDVEKVKGIKVVDVLKEITFAEDQTYIFMATDGYVVEIDANDLSKGILYQDEKGRLNVFFEGLPKNTRVKDLLSIEVKK